MSSPLGVFSEDIKIVPISSYVSGTADRNSEVIDTSGYGRCCVVVHFATLAAGSTYDISLTNSDVASDENTLTSGSAVAGSSQTVVDDDDNQVFYIDFIPTKRYYQLVHNKDGANAAAESAIAYLYHSKTRPVTQALGTSAIGEGAGAVSGENLGAAIQGAK